MGEDLVAVLVDRAGLDSLLGKSPATLCADLEAGVLRTARPQQATFLERAFDIDAEAEWLDWFDERSGWEDASPFGEALYRVGAEGGSLEWCTDGLLHAARWSSIGRIEIWEGRALLYIEALISCKLEHVDDLYIPSTWDALRKQVESISEQTCVEMVTMAWMSHRETLGETLDERSDPRILPTAEAHGRAVRTLHRLLSEHGPTTALLIGRDHLPTMSWRLDGILLSELLNDLDMLQSQVVSK
ncbi:MAG TPA: hypothetical protein QF646_05110 [Candidatus Poseidoniales archaeon]|nr:hypothetical protein [Candidatus Poseidoniales archaeon]